ncbi:MAG: DUF3990 domain-containing protein [Anaeroplasma bactoclasticum]|nr:DUF3990 domain-containing protein [Lachnospiraceae bacterium]MCM1514763.1 DUF3990 domain-containing protein [Anaeroplasma bactoclasticum]MCM1557658.1 DUF3990 domain-containing protein [Anaeroplasma bactoclasticum]
MIAEVLNCVAKAYVSYVGNPKLMNNVMAEIEITLPVQEDEQDKISALLGRLDNLIILHQRKCEKLKIIKKNHCWKRCSCKKEAIMLLYYGSNVEVVKPKIMESDRRLDFGTGFYLTSSLEQAQRWAKLATERRKTGVPTVSVYEFDKDAMDKLVVKQFAKADADWLKFITENRNGIAVDFGYDIIIGAVANDKTMPSILMFLMGIYNEEETLRRLMPQKLKDQFVFKTSRAVELLKLKEVIRYE